MSLDFIELESTGEAFYDITDKVEQVLEGDSDGLLYLFVTHTSCALTISEAYDPSAKGDLEAFLKYLAPRNLDFIKHDCEGPDDSPSHMKSMLLQQNLMLPVDKGKLELGRWQGIYLAEFRDGHRTRRIKYKFLPDK